MTTKIYSPLTRPKPLRLWFLLIATLLWFHTSITHAQLGSGWNSYTVTKKIHLDNEAGLQIYDWTAYKSVCSNPICADYTYDANAGTEQFRIFDSRSNRSEIRLFNEYSTGSRQFEGYVTIYAPLEDESLFQIFGSTSGATQLMIRGFAANNGTISGGGASISNIYGKEVRVNVIHLQEDVGNKFLIYFNGVKAGELADNENVTNYQKYGCYGTTNGNVPAVVKWRNVRLFRDGTAPSGSTPAAPSALTATAASSSQINLSWSDNSSNETSFQVERSTNGGTSWSTLTTLGANVESYSNTGLTAGATYHYRVRATNASGNSAYSNSANATTPSVPVQPTYQAETATISGGLVESNHAGYNGTGFVNYDNVTGSYVQWTINVASAGVYNLAIRNANGGTTDRPMSIIVNGTTTHASMSFNPTGAWSTWTSTAFTASLNAGLNTIRATATTSGGGPNVDQLEVSGAAAQNVALNKPVTASSSDTNVPANAVDGNTATRWSASPMPQWLEVDLGAVYSVSKTEVICYENRAYQFNVQVKTTSTGTYTQVVNRSTNTTPGTIAAPITNTFTPVSARYVRINVTGASGYTGTWASLIEFRVFGVLGGGGSVATASPVESTAIADEKQTSIPMLESYPNPGTSKITVKYSLKEAGRVHLQLYSGTGKQSTTLLNEYQEAGMHELPVDISQLPAGLHVLKLNVKDGMRIHKLVKN